MQQLAHKKCVPCEGGTRPLERSAIDTLLAQVDAQWQVADGKRLRRKCTFKNFRQAMAFVNAVASLAEAEGHHPDMAIFSNTVDITLWTHAIGGLSENDFILAAKIEQLRPS